MGLLDSLSRLSLSTDDIFTAANRTIADVGPFTDAVLGSHAITDIIRDAEEAEHTLFTHRSVQTPGGVVAVGRTVDVRPVSVHKAGLAGLGIGNGGGMGGQEREVDIEVLLGAAMRLVESYGSMPRAKGHIEQLLDRATEVRSRISLLEDELEELKVAGSNLPTEPEQPSLREEEKAVVTFEAQLAAARRKRDALRDQLQSKKRRNLGDPGHTISTPTAAARTRTRVGMGSKIPNPFLARAAALSAPPPPPPYDPDATTSIADQISGTSESLVDERPPAWADDSILSVAKSSDGEAEDGDDTWGGEEGVGEGAIPEVGAESVWEQEGPEDATVVLAIPPAVSFSPPPSPPKVAAAAIPLRSRASVTILPAPAPTTVPVAMPAPAVPVAAAPAPVKPAVEVKSAPSAPSVAKEVKVTPEMEANTALIWSTVGKVIAPLSNYGDDNPAPNAAQTFSILQSLASQSFANAPFSPSTASSLQNPSEPAPAQTILTAVLLLYLLREGPSPLPAVRTALAEKEGETTAGLGIKALYACVAKKLLKIDRKGREATVRFEQE